MKVYNTLTKQKEDFVPLEKGKVRMYTCGPTVYDYSHIGHARTYTAFDVIHRWLEHKGYKVTWVMNITDVDDKMINRAKEMGISVAELATKMSQAFFEDMRALGIQPDIYCFATGHIPEMVELIQKLLDKGYAYIIDDGIYFDVSKFEDYGKLSGQKREDLIKHRVEPNPQKRNPGDFALWKLKKPGEPYWHTPWGDGRPGWHIECSAMSSKYLGEQFDIHGGGQDLIFPHHENEIAQSEAAFGKKPWVKYWMHTGFLNIRGEKMSKSLGNIIPIREALKKWDPEVLRLFFVSKHYRSQIDFREEYLEETRENLNRLYNFLDSLERLKRVEGEDEITEKVSKLFEEFEEAMDDDFNTPKAIAVVFDVVRLVNDYIKSKKTISEKSYKIVKELMGVFSEVFGVLKKKPDEKLLKIASTIAMVREKLRKRKDFELSDYIREELAKEGLILEDTESGTRIRIEL